jgi:hypothetical protein
VLPRDWDAPESLAALRAQATAVVLAAGERKEVQIGVGAELRCSEGGCADGIRSDGGSYDVNIGSDGNLAFSLANHPHRSVVFDFSNCVADCTGGNRWFARAEVGAVNGLWMHTSVLVPGTDDETSQGFHDIPIGATWFSRIKILFSVLDPSNDEFAWAIRFNPFFQGSTNLQVTRVSEDEWVLEALSSQTAWTQSVLVTKRVRDREPLFEGNYQLPFAMTIRVR